MNIIKTTLAVASLVALSACSTGGGGPAFAERIDSAMDSPQMQELKAKVDAGMENALYYTAEGASSVQRRLQIAKFPKVQPVIVRYGSNLAINEVSSRNHASQWDPSRKHSYSVELPSGEIFYLEQQGPQFYRNQMATLLKHGLSVTLVP